MLSPRSFYSTASSLNSEHPQNHIVEITPPSSSPLLCEDRQGPLSHRSTYSSTLSQDSTQEIEQVRVTSWLKMKTEVPLPFGNVFAGLFTGLLLAGFIVLPGTIRTCRLLGKGGKPVIHIVQDMPLLYISGICCAFGALGFCWIGWANRTNWIWLVDRVFIPIIFSSSIGLMTTLLNVHTQNGFWSITSKIATFMTTAAALLTLILYFFYAARVEKKWREHCAANYIEIESSISKVAKMIRSFFCKL